MYLFHFTILIISAGRHRRCHDASNPNPFPHSMPVGVGDNSDLMSTIQASIIIHGANIDDKCWSPGALEFPKPNLTSLVTSRGRRVWVRAKMEDRPKRDCLVFTGQVYVYAVSAHLSKWYHRCFSAICRYKDYHFRTVLTISMRISSESMTTCGAVHGVMG